MTQEIVTNQETTQVMKQKSIIEIAIEKGATVNQLERIWALNMQYEANEARKAFVAAMNVFRSNPPRIEKNRRVSFGKTEYSHATLNNVCDKIGAALTKVGISFRWETNQDAGLITVSCILTHSGGHAEKTTLAASPDASGGKNSIQAVGSTVTYLQRYTLMSATGTATEDKDDDGAQSVDISTAIYSLRNAETLDKLQEAFKSAWNQYPQQRAELTKAKDEVKRAIMAEAKQ